MAATALPNAQRLAQVARMRCGIFETAYNPTRARTGAKYLKKALVGPKMADYYAQRQAKPNFAAINRAFADLVLVDPMEKQRLEDVELRRRRGKGPPKKGEGKKQQMAAKKKK